MKKSNSKLIFTLALMWALMYGQLQAQVNVNMAANGVTIGSPFSIAPPGTCFFNFFDNGGPIAGYNNNANASITFQPSNAATHRIQATFTTFLLEVGYDALYIYNSSTVGFNQVPGPQGATLSGFPAGNWQNINPGTITANTGIANVGANAAEALTFQFRSDIVLNAPGWSAIVRQVPKDACTMTAPAAQNVNTGLGATSCAVVISTPLPTFAPMGCNAGYQIRYRLNGGAAVNAVPVGPEFISVPVGNNIITWELVDPCGGGIISTANQSVIVNDNTFPAITCPSNMTINLGEGECSNNISYSVLCSDNCPSTVTRVLTDPIANATGQAGIMFDLVNQGSSPLTINQFGPSLDAGTWPMEVYFTHSVDSWVGQDQNPMAWTLAGSIAVLSTGPGAGTAIPGFGITLAPGQSIGIYLTSSTGTPLNYGFGSTNAADGSLRISSAPAAGKGYPFAGTFNDRNYDGFVRYTTAAPMVIVQTSGVPSGEAFPIGTTINEFKCTDGAGNMTTCSFSIKVNEFANPTWSLTCNDLVIVSLGDECMTEMSADDILEGGPYRCFDHYIVELDKIAPFGNGPWVPAILTAADVGKTYKARVTEPITGNKCTGDVKILDQEPPKMDCTPTPLVLPCNFPTEPEYAGNATVTVKYPVFGLTQSIVDFQTREYELPVIVSAGTVVNDVDFKAKISGDAFFNNMRIQVESPNGTVVTVWDQLGGCAPAPIFVCFDDEGTNLLDCPTYSTGINAQIPLGFGVMSSFDGETANGTWKIRITDMDSGSDLSFIDQLELYIQMTGIFGTGFPNGLSAPPVTKIGNNTYNVPAGLMDDCSPVTLTYFDITTNQNCSSPYTAIITRRWTATDVSGNTTTCIQTINMLRPTLNDITPPPDYDDIDLPGFDCDNGYPTPDWIESQGLQGYPYAFGLPDLCNLNSKHTDNRVGICSGSYDIVRTWTVLDPCMAMGSIEYQQIIHVRDNTGPVFIDCPPNMIESTDPYNCCATFNLPDILVEDNCSKISDVYAVVLTINPFNGDTIAFIPVEGDVYDFPGNLPNDPDTLAAFGTMPCIPIGEHIVVYFAQDDCGNVGTCSFNLVVADYSPPSPACDETTIVSIGVDDPTDCYYTNQLTCEFAGITWAHAETFDDGSYDQCSPIKFTIRRAAPYSDCITALDQTPCPGNANDFSEYELATAESDSIKFYCCEVGTTQTVILRVYQLNYDGSISTYPDGTPIFNECQVEVTVQDKLKPVCEPPFNVTVSCENFDPSLWAYGKPTAYDNCCLDVTKEYQGQKGLTHSVNYNQFDTTCNRGTILRTFRVYDCKGASNQCTQRIIVNYEQDYFVKFPDDKIISVCDGTGVYGEPTFYGEDCELLGVSFEDEVFTVVPDACFKIERTWKIINWCTYNPQGSCIAVPNPNPNATLNHPTNLPGPTVSAGGTLSPWNPTVVKINPTDQTATNYSIFWSASANCYVYKQIIKVIDNQPPIVDCPIGPLTFCDETDNNPFLWNESYWYEPITQSHDLCEGPVDVGVVATDLCSGVNLTIRYILFLDLDGDGQMETVVSSSNPPAAGTVNYNNVNTPNFTGGTVRNFDERQVSPSQKFRFGLQTTITGTNVSAAVRWNTPAAPNNYVIPELPYGTHKIKWIVGDGCGNESVCEYTFIVKDCKPPTVVCNNGLSVNMMPTGMIMVFASDFLVHVSDNCTPEDYIKFGIRKKGTGTGFPVDANGNPVVSLVFTCDDIGMQAIELWVVDLAGNADFCESFIVIQDNAGNCNADMATVSGALKTEIGDGLEESDVELSGHHPSGSTFNHFDITDQSGAYGFTKAVPMYANYIITPTKDDNPLNGVTTYDLVLMSKHILGIQPLGSPYKMIAADANLSGSITTSDIVELRKLILGIYQELPSNTSWRFVDNSFVFNNPDNPFATPFPESKSVAEIHANATGDDFVAIKVGDVNNSMVANSLMVNEDRSVGTLVFDVEDRAVKAGEIVDVKFKAADQATAYQFTLNYKDLEIVDILPGTNMKSDNFAIFPSENAMTTSWNGNGTAEFTLKFKARAAGEINKMLTLSSRITKAEAYRATDDDSDIDALSLALRFNGKEGSVLTGVGFELYQNQPNPFVNRTSIGFHLPEAATAHLTVHDQAGRLVFSQKGEFQKGYNSFLIDKAMVNTAGVLYYTLETSTDAATRKMVQTK